GPLVAASGYQAELDMSQTKMNAAQKRLSDVVRGYVSDLYPTNYSPEEYQILQRGRENELRQNILRQKRGEFARWLRDERAKASPEDSVRANQLAKIRRIETEIKNLDFSITALNKEVAEAAQVRQRHIRPEEQQFLEKALRGEKVAPVIDQSAA